MVHDEDNKGCSDPTNQHSLHGGLSQMRLVLGANDRRLHAQKFGKTNYKEAMEHERQRMVCTVKLNNKMIIT